MRSGEYQDAYDGPSCLEKAHCDPGTNATSGRGPGPGHGALGTATVPATAFAFPWPSVEPYCTFHAVSGVPEPTCAGGR